MSAEINPDCLPFRAMQWETFEPTLERGIDGAAPLLHTPDAGILLRQMIDWNAQPVHDFETFSRRHRLYSEFTDFVGVAKTDRPVMTEQGGMFVADFIDGTPINELLTGQAQKQKPDKQLGISVIAPLLKMQNRMIDYYASRIPDQKPVVLDVIKSNQMMFGRSAADPKKRLYMVDGDALATRGEDGAYTSHDRLLILRFAHMPLASLIIYVNAALMAMNSPQARMSLQYTKLRDFYSKIDQSILNEGKHETGEIYAESFLHVIDEAEVSRSVSVNNGLIRRLAVYSRELDTMRSAYSPEHSKQSIRFL